MTQELVYAIIAVNAVSVVSVAIHMVLSWHLDWPEGQGRTVPGGFLGICAISS